MNWSKGETKYTHPSVMKISATMKARKVNNFKNWMDEARETGLIPRDYPAFNKDGDLAEYIAVVLGDGNISRFDRTERLIISCNSKNTGFVNRYALLTKKIFKKDPTVSKVYNVNNIRISIYQKEISRRLGVPSGNRKDIVYKLPNWIKGSREFSIRFLRGLFEAEGSLSIHKPTSTYNFQFCNKNDSLLRIVEGIIRSLGFNSEVRKIHVRLRRKAEVERFRELIRFRMY